MWMSLCLLIACSGGEEEASAPPVDPAAGAVQAAEKSLREGDLARAEASFQEVLATTPTHLDAAVGASYLAMLRGDAAAADAILAAAEAGAGDGLGQLEVRRAMLAVERGDMPGVRTHGEASGLPQGQLLAAEAALAGAEVDAAIALLESASAGGGAAASTAKHYLDLLNHDDFGRAAVAELYALWAMGSRQAAARSAPDVVSGLDDAAEDKGTELLFWAGRAASVGEAEAAAHLLSAIVDKPPGQAWRVSATQTLVQCADGEAEACTSGLASVAQIAPDTAVLHTRATAALALGRSDSAAGLALLSGHPGEATARAALELGDVALARELAPDGLFADHLAAR